MPVEKIDITDFLKSSTDLPVLDVRSPGEFAHAHIPNAFSIPLFTDEQRKIIGTAYVQESRQTAVNHGLNYFSERMKVIPGEVFTIVEQFSKENRPEGKEILVHCWRGGMRSETVAWLMSLYGFKVSLLTGGYKAFRNWVLQQFEKQYSLKVLGGFTGSGKTQVLKELKKKGDKVIDLEALANHRGSAFGALGQMPQPSTEMFENMLAVALWKLQQNQEENGSPIWLEDESIHIGTVGIPKKFWEQMRNSPLYFLQIPFEERLKNVVEEYGVFPAEKLAGAVLKIQKRLGGVNAKNAVDFLNCGDFEGAFSILLKYYDKMYNSSLVQRHNIDSILNVVDCEKVSVNNANVLSFE